LEISGTLQPELSKLTYGFRSVTGLTGQQQVVAMGILDNVSSVATEDLE
jgi:hypothetical protein